MVWPSLLLPNHIVVKKRKPDWNEEFENERNMYQRLKSLQGSVIPRFYGDAICEGSPALILSEVVGVLPFQQKLPPLPREEFQKRVESALEELRKFGLSYDDVKLDNMLLVEKQLVFVDLESVSESSPEDSDALFESGVYNIMLGYDRYLRNPHND